MQTARSAHTFRAVSVCEDVYFCDLCCKSLAEFRRPQTAEGGESIFSGGVYVGKTRLSPQVCGPLGHARGGLHPLEKMPAF